MSIIIKGMEMPNHCEFCGFCHYYGGNVWCNATNQRLKYGLTINKPDWCPLVEIPETKIDDRQDLDLDSEAVEAWLKEVFNIFGARMEGSE